MQRIETPNQVDILSWCPDLEAAAFIQALNLTKLPFAHMHMALMPDAHMGMGMPIGGVIATKDYIIPNAVGVDIGCGVLAAKLTCTEESIRSRFDEIVDFLDKDGVRSRIRRESCIGVSIEEAVDMPFTPHLEQFLGNADMQAGTLGGGNHFIEFQRDSDGHVWLMIHSGSRNTGKQVGDYYDKLATKLNKQHMSPGDPKDKLAYLHVDSKEGKEYTMDMDWCNEYAKLNRYMILATVKEAINRTHPKRPLGKVNPVDTVHCLHNFARLENHFGKNVWVHRKGAISARKGEIACIPGSQGTASYIVEGLGSEWSFHSCSHGAGRLMSRKRAKEELNLEMQQLIMDDQNILHGMKTVASLDEAPEAYKDIDVVMENQKDLVKIVHKLEPFASIKG